VIHNPPLERQARIDSRTKLIYQWLLFLGILALFAILIIPTVNRLGIGWDEEVDLRIARAYLTRSGLFFGIPLDESQTRLPMFIVALVFRFFGASNLLLARLTSIVVGGCTLLGIYLYGKERISPGVGLLAAGLLGINPFFLSFSRLAFTESDVYLACTLTWLLVSLARLQTKPSVGRAVVAGLFLGLSISAKATILVILPAVWFALLSVRFIKPNINLAEINYSIRTTLASRIVWFLALWSVMVLLSGIYSGMSLIHQILFRFLPFDSLWICFFRLANPAGSVISF
jgi:4-amino-4-deoxy-L-arabinose transferase-like glycosyltransferase